MFCFLFFFFASLFNVTIPKKFGSATKISVKIKSYLSIYLATAFLLYVN